MIAAKAVAFHEALQPEFKTYGKQVIKNAQAMANEFLNRDYKIASGGTDNHLMLLDLTSKNITGKLAEEILGKIDITVNKNMIPFDEQSPFVTSGIRIGTSAITTRGLDEQACIKIVDWIDLALMSPDDNALHNKLKEQVITMMSEFPLYAS